MAVTALVLGICGLVVCPVILSIPAIVFGAIAQRDIAGDPDVRGKGMAQAGFITGIVGTALGIVLIIILIAVGVATDQVQDQDPEPGNYQGPGYGREYDLN